MSLLQHLYFHFEFRTSHGALTWKYRLKKKNPTLKIYIIKTIKRNCQDYIYNVYLDGNVHGPSRPVHAYLIYYVTSVTLWGEEDTVAILGALSTKQSSNENPNLCKSFYLQSTEVFQPVYLTVSTDCKLDMHSFSNFEM